MLLSLFLLLIESLQDGDDGVQVISLGGRHILKVVHKVTIWRVLRVAISCQAGSCLLRQKVLLSVLTLVLFLDDSRGHFDRDLVLLQLLPLSIPFAHCRTTVWVDLPDGL